MRLENGSNEMWPVPVKVHQSPCSRTFPFLFRKIMLSREEVYACLCMHRLLHNGDSIHAGASSKDWMREGKKRKTQNYHLDKEAILCLIFISP